MMTENSKRALSFSLYLSLYISIYKKGEVSFSAIRHYNFFFLRSVSYFTKFNTDLNGVLTDLAAVNSQAVKYDKLYFLFIYFFSFIFFFVWVSTSLNKEGLTLLTLCPSLSLSLFKKHMTCILNKTIHLQRACQKHRLIPFIDY